jgi:HlyD family secretion protein
LFATICVSGQQGVGVKKRVIILLLLVLALVFAAVYWWMQRHSVDDSAHLVLYGNVDIREVRLAFDGAEHVDAILVEEGDRVDAGQLLATLHTDRLRAERDRVAAELAAAEAEAHAATLSHRRIEQLASQQLASRDDADVAEAKARVALANAEAAEAALAETDQALKDTHLYAPQAGVIRERVVEPGDFVNQQNPVLTLALTNPVWVRTYLPENRLGQVKPGMHAEIHTDSFPGRVYEGWVGYISPTAEFTPKSVETPELRTRLVYQLRVYACNPDNELRLGMPATVKLLPEASSSPPVPAEEQCAQDASSSPDRP